MWMLWLWLTFSVNAAKKDVCIVGGGASGMYASVWLNDRNYSLVLLESQDRVGGHCDTISNPTRFGSILDVGVVFWIDTQKLNTLDIGHWDIDTVSFVERFAGPDSVVPVNLSRDPRIGFYVDMTKGTNEGRVPSFPPVDPSPEYQDAWNRFFVIVNNQYPWIGLYDYPLNYFPDPIPSELLVPFSEWITANNMMALLPFFHAFLNTGGYSPYEDWRALDALLNLPPAILKAIENPFTGFIIQPGCQTMYNNIAKELEASGQEVILNANMTYAVRTKDLVNIKGYNTQTRAMFSYDCEKLVIAYPQTEAHMQWMDLDEKEASVFHNVQTEYYFDGYATVTGGELQSIPFNIMNFNASNPFGNPSSPAVISIARALPSGYASILASSTIPISLQDMQNVIKEQTDKIPASLASFEVQQVRYHEYEPNFFTSALNQVNNGYQQIQKLQGYRNTWYIGSLLSCPGSYVNQEFVEDLFSL